MRAVLVVTDADWVYNDVVAALDRPGTTIAREHDPRAVVGTAEDHQPSVYLVDMQVGSMGGMAITRQLKDAFHAGALAVGAIIMLLDRSADDFIARRAGADGWVVKPFTAQALRAAVAEATPAHT